MSHRSVCLQECGGGQSNVYTQETEPWSARVIVWVSIQGRMYLHFCEKL